MSDNTIQIFREIPFFNYDIDNTMQISEVILNRGMKQ